MRYNYNMQRRTWKVVELAQDYGRGSGVTLTEITAMGRCTLAELVSGGLE